MRHVHGGTAKSEVVPAGGRYTFPTVRRCDPAIFDLLFPFRAQARLSRFFPRSLPDVKPPCSTWPEPLLRPIFLSWGTSGASSPCAGGGAAPLRLSETGAGHPADLHRRQGLHCRSAGLGEGVAGMVLGDRLPDPGHRNRVLDPPDAGGGEGTGRLNHRRPLRSRGAASRRDERSDGASAQVPKKSLPLSSVTMKAGKSSTSMRQTASMPSSSYSTTSTRRMWSWARRAAEPPMEPR